MGTRKVLAIGIVVLFLVGAVVFFGMNYLTPQESFSVNTVLLKLNILEGGETTNTIRIVNNENVEQNFKISFSGLDDFVSLSESEFVLASRDVKEIKIDFKDVGGKVGIYVGKLIFETELMEKEIPVILNIEDKNRRFAILNSPIKGYENIYPGGKLGVQVKLFNLINENVNNVHAVYSIKNFEDEIILVSEEDLTIKGGIETTKVFDVPKNIELGEYVFITSIDFVGTQSASAYIFEISEKKEGIGFTNFNFLVFVIIGFIILIVILFFYYVKSSDDLLVQLKKQHKSEVRCYSANIEKKKKESLAKAKTEKEKQNILNDFRYAKRKILNEMKKEQSKQRKELSKLKSEKKNKKMIQSKFPKWEKNVYSRALKSAEVSAELKSKLGVLKQALSEGYISKESYEKGESRIKSAHRKLKRKSL